MNIYIIDTFTFVSLAEHNNSLCACWHPEAMKGSSSSSSRRLLVLSPITSPFFHCLGSTDAPCSRLGDPVPLSPKWRPHSQGPRTLLYLDSEQYCLLVCCLLTCILSAVLYGGRGGISALSPKIMIFKTAVTRQPGNILTSRFFYSFHHEPHL
jgi:hypothetical protein